MQYRNINWKKNNFDIITCSCFRQHSGYVKINSYIFIYSYYLCIILASSLVLEDLIFLSDRMGFILTFVIQKW